MKSSRARLCSSQTLIIKDFTGLINLFFISFHPVRYLCKAAWSVLQKFTQSPRHVRADFKRMIILFLISFFFFCTVTMATKGKSKSARYRDRLRVENPDKYEYLLSQSARRSKENREKLRNVNSKLVCQM